MKREKISIILSIILSIIMVSSCAAIVSADEPKHFRSVSGYVYDLSENPLSFNPSTDSIVIMFGDTTYPGTVYETPTGYYIFDFEEQDGLTGSFYIIRGGFAYTAVEPLLLEPGEEEYYGFNLHIDLSSGVQIIPTKVQNLQVNDAKDGKLDLSWDPATDNDGIDHYNIYWDQNGYTSPVATVNDPTTTYQHTGLNNDQTYTYKVSAVDAADNEGPLSDQASGTPTASSSDDNGGNGGNGDNGGDNGGGGGAGGGGGGAGGGGTGGTNQDPTAVASASETIQSVDLPITFNGSQSSDPDGDPLTFTWDFGDGNTGTGETTDHTYSTVGLYTVTLTVSDGKGGEDEDTLTIDIRGGANKVPTAPTVTGDQTGNKNTEYSYTAVSTDEDNDDIKYTFDWGDGETTTTEFLANGTEATQNHTWTSAGKYTIKVKANDNKTDSGTTELVVLIDAHLVDDIGYITDDNANGTYEKYHDNEETVETSTEKQTNGTYLLDTDGDGSWNYYYDPDTDTLTSYSQGATTEEGDNTIWYMLGAGMIIVILLVAGISIVMKKKKK